MSNQEAIASLKTLCHTCELFPKCVNDKPECFQAIELAISALEAQESSQNVTNGDSISREAALDILDDLQIAHEQGMYGAYEDYRKQMCELPSAQRWIPVSGRLPENEQLCLVTKRGFGKTKVVDIATYSTNLYKIDEREFCDEKGKSGWYYYDNEFGYCQPLGVVAWMPLLEPYQEESV